jgi:hypothetical protein
MKAIELTEEHKKKLLEMCNKLFPKHCKFEFFTEDLRFLNEETDEFLTFIHWFEFCMTHLQNQILIVASNLNKSDVLEYEFFSKLTDSWYESHPINFLYEEFKKLK